ncbi:hypothetical protein MOA99_05535 [Bacillus haynesii]|uniref:hypothetical protein n=1 Tax=Bacillus haynesii TaxID=1925021 RepID=UPI00227EE087|nr:hypothetical protein [Bacillus haynesii]MCY7848117.1 hypothetical protein [Bacillus haynesii]
MEYVFKTITFFSSEDRGNDSFRGGNLRSGFPWQTPRQSSILREVETLNLSLAVALVISVFLNIFQLAQLKSNNRKNVKWEENTKSPLNPFTAILWTYFAIIILFMLAALVTVIIQLNE